MARPACLNSAALRNSNFPPWPWEWKGCPIFQIHALVEALMHQQSCPDESSFVDRPIKLSFWGNGVFHSNDACCIQR